MFILWINSSFAAVVRSILFMLCFRVRFDEIHIFCCCFLFVAKNNGLLLFFSSCGCSSHSQIQIKNRYASVSNILLGNAFALLCQIWLADGVCKRYFSIKLVKNYFHAVFLVSISRDREHTDCIRLHAYALRSVHISQIYSYDGDSGGGGSGGDSGAI